MLNSILANIAKIQQEELKANVMKSTYGGHMLQMPFVEKADNCCIIIHLTTFIIYYISGSVCTYV